MANPGVNVTQCLCEMTPDGIYRTSNLRTIWIQNGKIMQQGIKTQEKVIFIYLLTYFLHQVFN